jgi:hypothetical protein
MAERMIEANGVELCTEAFGNPADPTGRAGSSTRGPILRAIVPEARWQ